MTLSPFDGFWIVSIGISLITIVYVIYILKFRTTPENTKKHKPQTGDRP